MPPYAARPPITAALLVAAAAASLMASGCVRRTITVTSEPPGALLWLNGREIGRTPIELDFLYYGIYDVQLVAEGYEPLITTGEASPPWWDRIPFDLAAEVSPGEKHVHIAWHYDLQPPDDDPQALLDRARELRSRIAPAQVGPAAAAGEDVQAGQDSTAPDALAAPATQPSPAVADSPAGSDGE